MARFDPLKGLFGLLPTPYDEDLEIHTSDLRAAADFVCATGQHGIVWPVMVGEYYFLGESERVRNLDAVLEEVNGRLPVVFGCSGISVPQTLFFARAAHEAGADAIIAMAPPRSDPSVTVEMFHRLGDVYPGPIMVQNATGFAPLTGEQIAVLAEQVPQIDYVKEERAPWPRGITDVKRAVGDRIKGIFGGVAGKVLPAELARGADGCMPACEFGDLLTRVVELWWAGDEAGARELHSRILPLVNLESHYFARYVLRRRGVFTSMVERAPTPDPLDDEDKREIATLVRAIEADIRDFPYVTE